MVALPDIACRTAVANPEAIAGKYSASKMLILGASPHLTDFLADGLFIWASFILGSFFWGSLIRDRSLG